MNEIKVRFTPTLAVASCLIAIREITLFIASANLVKQCLRIVFILK